jgi:transcriptional regulator with XRE-family HTH domain
MVPEHRFGEQLRRIREQAGVSLGELAVRTNYTKGYLSKVENGHKPPNPALARLCDAALSAHGTLIRILPPWPVAAKPIADDVLSREVLFDQAPSLDQATSFDQVLRYQEEPGFDADLVPAQRDRRGGASGADTVAEFDTRFVLARDFAQRFGPTRVVPLVRTELEILVSLVRQMAEDERKESLLLAARYAEFAGWMHQEAGDDKAAEEQTARAVRLSALSGDTDIGAYSFVRRAEIRMHQDDAESTIALSARAQAMLSASDRVRGLAAQREAQGHALAGAESRCLDALDRSNQLLESAERSGSATHVLGSTKSPNSGAMVRGWCLFDLGRPAEAADLLEREIPAFAPGSIRARARFATRLALAHATDGELDRTYQIADWLLDDLVRVDSATIRQDVRRLARTLARWRGDPRVRALRPRLTEVLRSL